MSTNRGAESLHDGGFDATVDVIAAYIVGGAWAAMDEWGKGSLMDTTNPALDAYRNSPAWNPARPDTAIRGRPKGYYADMWGRRQYSGGGLEGVNLEELGDQWLPRAPSHAIATAARWMRSHRFQAVLNDVLRSFPWGNFLEINLRS
jgi:hypothetical protein